MYIFLTGCFPYIEGLIIQRVSLEELLRNNPSVFWLTQEGLLGNPDVLTEDFKTLFMSMVKEDTVERATILEIQQSKWYQGEVYTYKEYKSIITSKLGLDNL